MPLSAGDRADGEALRLEAADWWARMRGPDAERSRLEFERWRAADPARRAAYARLEQEWEVSGGLRNSAIGRARQLPRKSSWGGSWRSPRFALAGTVLAAVVAGLGWTALGPVHRPASATLASAVGQIRTLRLPDDSTVTLDTDSVVALAFSDTQRAIRLVRGRARFDVAPDALRPFVVAVGGQSVVATGTLFDVALLGSSVQVNLIRGTVDLRGEAAPSSKVVAHLTAGQSLTLGTGKGVPAIGRTPAGAERWVGGMLSFDGTPLGDVLAQTNRYSRQQVRLGDDALGSLRVTGVFRPAPTGTLSGSLAAALALRVDHPSPDLYVLRRP